MINKKLMVLAIILVSLFAISAVSAAEGNVTSDNLTTSQDSKVQNEMAIENEEIIVGASQNEILETGDNLTDNYTYSININPQLIKDPLGTGVVSRSWSVELPYDARGNVSVFINGSKAYNTTLGNHGEASIVIKDLNFNFTYDTYDVTVVYSGDNKYAGFNETRPVEIIYMSTRLEDNEVGDSYYCMLVDVSADVTGNITLIVNNKTYTAAAPNKAYYVKVILDNLVYGENNYTVIYEGNGILPPKNITGISVLKPTINLPYYDYYGSEFDAEFAVPSDASGKFIVTLDDTVYNVTLINGKAILSLGQLKAGMHYISARYDGTDYIVNTTGKYVGVYPVKDKGEFYADGRYGEVITLTANDDANANVSVYQNSVYDEGYGTLLFNVSLKNGKAVIPINSSMIVGKNELILDYHFENNMYNETFYDILMLTVSNCICIPSNITFHENKNISITFPSDIENNLIVYMDNSEVVYNSTPPDGTVNITTENLSVGSHTILVAYSGDGKYPAQNYTEKFTVNGVYETFADLQSLINSISNGGNLKLDMDYQNNGSESEITISKAITIDGKGHTLDANGKSRVFNIQSGMVILKNIVFKNGYCEGSGGAVYFSSSGNVTNCNFTNNQAADYMSSGGAIGMYSGTVENCNFVNNTAYYGGAIWFISDGNVANSNFTDNLASYDGGAVLGSGNVTNCNFTNNSGVYGGAVNLNNGNVSNCNFTNNRATSYYSAGGAVYMGSGNVTNCNFTNNSAGNGGAVCFWSDGELTNCTFVNNTAPNLNGGAVHMVSGTLTNCNFTDNAAGSRGGAIVFTGDGNVTNCTFVNNTAANGDGGAILIYSGTVENCSFVNNTAYGIGGAICFSSRGNITNCNLTGNTEPQFFNPAQGNLNTTMLIETNATELHLGEDISITVSVLDQNNETVNGNVDIYINSASIGSKSIGEAFTYSPSEEGDYIVEARFNETLNYTGSSNFTSFTVMYSGGNGSSNETPVNPKNESRTLVIINSANIYLGDNVTITGIVFNQNNEMLTGSVDVYVNSTFIGSKNIGEAFTYTPSELGKYNIEVRFSEDSSYNASSGKASFNVIPSIVPETITSDDTGTILLQFPINATGTLAVYIDGDLVEEINVTEALEKFKNATQGDVSNIVMGILKIDLSQYNGKYTITFEYSGDENYCAFTTEAYVTVKEKNPSIVASNMNTVYTAGPTYTIKVYEDTGIVANGATVVVKMNGKSFKTLPTNANGVASFKVSQTPGTYKLTITSLGKTVTPTLTVKHLVTLKTATVKKSAKKLVLQATLAKVNGKYLKNKRVTFKFNGKKYTAKTNKKGVAKVTIKSSVLKKLKVGKKVTYQATYSKDTVKKTAKVKK